VSTSSDIYSFLSLRSQLSTIMDAFTIITGKVSLNSKNGQELILNHQVSILFHQFRPQKFSEIFFKLMNVRAALKASTTSMKFLQLCATHEMPSISSSIIA
jgi:hypothetical protein